MKTIAARTRNSAATNLSASGEVESDARTCAGRVRVRTVRIDDANTSFHETTKRKTAPAARLGVAGGSATGRNALNRVEPSVSAASSRARGTDAKPAPA